MRSVPPYFLAVVFSYVRFFFLFLVVSFYLMQLWAYLSFLLELFCFVGKLILIVRSFGEGRVQVYMGAFWDLFCIKQLSIPTAQFIKLCCRQTSWLLQKDTLNYFLFMLILVSGCYQEFNCNSKMLVALIIQIIND